MLNSVRLRDFFISVHRNISNAFLYSFRRFTINSLSVRGFTLIELLIVMAIIGVLATAILVAINPGKRTRQAQDAKRKNDIGALATEVQAYYTYPGLGKYPVALSDLVNNKYLKQMPTDPTSTGAAATYSYVTGAAATEVAVWATLAEPTSGTQYAWVWCYQTQTGKAQEITQGQCTAP